MQTYTQTHMPPQAPTLNRNHMQNTCTHGTQHTDTLTHKHTEKTYTDAHNDMHARTHTYNHTHTKKITWPHPSMQDLPLSFIILLCFILS